MRAVLLVLAGVCLASWLCAIAGGQDNPAQSSGLPYKNMLDDPAVYTGPVSIFSNPPVTDAVRIGLFGPLANATGAGSELVRGAELAVNEANRLGGYQGIPFRLVARWADRPWISGANELIRLAYADGICALVGSLDGETTHLAEQVATKAWIPLLSPLASDDTLTQIRLPWIFSLPPADREQALLLVSQGIAPRCLQRLGMITSTDHDGRVFADSMTAVLKREGLVPAFHFTVSLKEDDWTDLARRASDFSPDGLILRLPAVPLLQFIEQLNRRQLACPLFLPWIPGLDAASLHERYAGDLACIRPFDESSERYLHHPFVAAYEKAYQCRPDPGAAYAFDAVSLLIQCIRAQGPHRIELQKALWDQKDFSGVTGMIHWDNGGGNTTPPHLLLLSSLNP